MIWVRVASVLGFLAVALGAFGAHALRGRVDAAMLAAFETGARYHFYHALALLAVGWLHETHPSGWAAAAGVAFVVGIVVFSGSLYLMAASGARWLGAVTPVGGTALLAGWILLLVASFRAA